MDDQAAMVRLRAGDAAGLEHLYHRYFSSLYRFAGRQLGDWDAAQDIAQDALIRAWRYASSYRQGAPVAPWLFRIAFRLCLDRAHGAGREAAGLRVGVGRVHSDPRSAEAEQLQAAIARALATLPSGQRAAFLLHRVHGVSAREVGAILDCPAGTVKSRAYHAAQRLRPVLQAYLGEDRPCASRT